MSDELDDTRSAPPRRETTSRIASERDSNPDVLADTIMTARRASVELIEPPVEPTPRRGVESVIGLSVGIGLDPTEPPQPHLAVYSFRIGEQPESIMLDRPTRVGRDPAVSRIVVGATPRLVRVNSATNEVSATHLEVRQVGSSVIVTDLRSTNGSVVMQPGSVPRKLRQGESVVVSPGTLVDIGDKNIIQILPMQRLG